MSSLTPKQEAFCQAVASGTGISDAYRAAYDSSRMKAASVNRQAKSLIDDPKIAARVKELRQPAIEAAQYSLKTAMDEAAEALQVARQKENGGAMVAAVTLRAKLSGLLVEKKEVRTGELDGLPHDQITKLRDALRSLDGSGAAGSSVTGGQARTTH